MLHYFMTLWESLAWLTSLPTFNTVSLFMPVVKQWRAIHVEGQQSDQSDNLAI